MMGNYTTLFHLIDVINIPSDNTDAASANFSYQYYFANTY